MYNFTLFKFSFPCPYSILVSIPACHAGDRGSIPRLGARDSKSNRSMQHDARVKGKVFPYSLLSVGPELIPVYRQSARR